MPASAGVVFEIETKIHGALPAQVGRTSIQAQGAFLKLENSGGQRGDANAMVYHGERREMLVVDHQRQTYMLIDRQFVDRMLGQLSQASSQMQGMLENVPPAQRAMMEQMAKQQMSAGQTPAKANVQVLNSGQQATVYGYPCLLMKVTRDGQKVRDVWVTDWRNIAGASELTQSFNGLSTFFQEITSGLPMQSNTPIKENVFANLQALGGFPVATREYRADGSLLSESALRSATQQSINPAAFEPPTGYRAESMFGGATSTGAGQPTGQFGQRGR